MIEREQDDNERRQFGSSPGHDPGLPYAVELRATQDSERVDKILARATSMKLAHAIFEAARNEYPGRRIVLRSENESSSLADTDG